MQILNEGLYFEVKIAKQLISDLLTGRIYFFFFLIIFLLTIQPMLHALGKENKIIYWHI